MLCHQRSGRGEFLTANFIFDQNLRLDFVRELQGGRTGGKPFQVKLADDEGRSADPFGITGSDDAIPDQRFPAAHSETGEQAAAVNRNGGSAEKKADGNLRIFWGFAARSTQPPGIFQAGIIVLVENKIESLEIGSHC